MKNVRVTVSGISPLLMNACILHGEKASKDLLPREQAEKKAYYDTKLGYYVPKQWMYAAIMNAGKNFKIGKKQVTTGSSSLLPGGCWIQEEIMPLKNKDFEVDSRPVVIPSTGGRIMAHRPRFDEWEITFTLNIDETVFSTKMIREMIDTAGKSVGIGDFRPQRKGWFGRFVVNNWKEI